MPPSLTARRPRWLALAGLPALVLLLFPGVVLRGQVFYERDVHLVWYSQVESFVRAVRGGSWPLWDPYVSFGHPMLANPNTQVLYPPTWINLVLAPESAYVVLTLAHLAWAGLGLFRFARRLEMSEAASAVAGAAWMASGPLLSLVNVWHHLAGASWIPWVFLAAENALASPSLRGAVLWGGALGMQLLAGSPDMSAFTGAAVVAFTLARLEWRRPLGATNRPRLAAAILALLFALGLSAAQLLPTLEATGRSMRWNIDPALRGKIGALHPLGAFAKLVSPIPLGDLPLDPVKGHALLDEGMPFLRSLYLGVPALALVLAALGARSPGSACNRGFFAGLGAGATFFALGHNTWVYLAFVTVFPALRMLRYPSKAMVLAAFAWAVLVGLGFERWRKRDPGPGGSWLLGVSLPLAAATLLLAGAWQAARNPAALLGTLLLPETTLGRPWTEALAGSVLPLGAATLFGAAALAAGLVHRRPEATAWALAVLVIADLALAGGRVNRTTSREFYRYRPSLLDAVDQGDLSRLLVRSYPESQPLLGVENPYKIASYPEAIGYEAGRALGARLALMPPVGAAWGLFASWERDLLGLYPEHLATLVAAVHEAEETPGGRRWLELGAVRYVATLDDRGLSDLTFVRDLPTPLVLPLRLYRVHHALPRTYVVGGARVASGEAARRLLVDPGLDLRREVVLASGSSSPASLPGTSRVTDLRADRVRLHASLGAPGYVVLVDTYDPGWRARIDGADAPVLRANEAFRAVSLPAGEHDVEMIYRPPSVRLGLGISAAALGLGLLALARPAGASAGNRGSVSWIRNASPRLARGLRARQWSTASASKATSQGCDGDGQDATTSRLTPVPPPTLAGAKTRRGVALDALRAVAVLLVLGRHLPPVDGDLPPALAALFRHWQRLGWMGVDLFFVLSGFLVAGLLFDEHARHGRIRPLRFLARRGFKIYPGFYFLLGVTWLWAHDRVADSRFLAEAFFVQNYFPAVWNHTWSLAIEEHFYLALTLLLWSSARGREGPQAFRGLPGLCAILFALVLALRVRAFAPFPRGYLLLPTHFRADALLFGTLLSYGWIFHRERLAALVYRFRWAIGCASVLLLLPCFLLPLEDNLTVNTIGLTANYLGFGGLVILTVAATARGAARLERALAPLAPIGFFSYSIYLWHMPVALAVHLLDVRRFGWPADVVAYLAGSLIVGIVAALAIEMPLLRLRDRIIPSATVSST